MFFFLPTALAAIALGWPCQRLNWAWRNVWVTCSINAYVPSTAPTSATGFTVTSSTPWTSFTGPSQLDANGQFQPSAAQGPALCVTSPNTGGTFMRNRCRRMLDVYGNLVKLCETPAKSNAGPNMLTPDWAPQTGHQPHAVNVANLGFMAQACLTPGAAYPTPTNTCPGLAGWFTVVWNACMFTNAPGVTAVQNFAGAPAGATFVPDYLGTSSSSASWALSTPSNLCGSVPELSGNSLTTTNSGVWNSKGPAFRSSRCRKALDQFGRTAYRCNPVVAPSTVAVGTQDPLRFLALGLGTAAPYCNA